MPPPGSNSAPGPPPGSFPPGGKPATPGGPPTSGPPPASSPGGQGPPQPAVVLHPTEVLIHPRVVPTLPTGPCIQVPVCFIDICK